MVEPVDSFPDPNSYTFDEIDKILKSFLSSNEIIEKISVAAKVYNMRLKMKAIVGFEENFAKENFLNVSPTKNKLARNKAKLSLYLELKFTINNTLYYLPLPKGDEFDVELNRQASIIFGKNLICDEFLLQETLESDYLSKKSVPAGSTSLSSDKFFIAKKILEADLVNIFGTIIGRIYFSVSNDAPEKSKHRRISTNKTSSKAKGYKNVHIDSLIIYSSEFNADKALLSIKIGIHQREFPLCAAKLHPNSRPGCSFLNFNLYLIQLHPEYQSKPEQILIHLHYPHSLNLLNQDVLQNFDNNFLLKIMRASQSSYKMQLQIYERLPKYPTWIADISKSINKLGIETLDKEKISDFEKLYTPCDIHIFADTNQSEGLFYLHEGNPKKLVVQIEVGLSDQVSYSLHRVMLSKIETVNYKDVSYESSHNNSSIFANNDFIKRNEEFLFSLNQLIQKSFSTDEEKSIATCIKTRCEQFQRKDIAHNLFKQCVERKFFYPNFRNQPNINPFEIMFEIMEDRNLENVHMKIDHMVERDGKLFLSTVLKMDGLKSLCDPNLSTCYQMNLIIVLKIKIGEAIFPLVLSRKINFLLFPRRNLISKLSTKFSMNADEYLSNYLTKDYNVMWSDPSLDHNRLIFYALFTSINYEIFHFSSLNEENLNKLLSKLQKTHEQFLNDSKIEKFIFSSSRYQDLYLLSTKNLKKTSNIETKINENLKLNSSSNSVYSSPTISPISKNISWFNTSGISDKLRAFKDIFSDHSTEPDRQTKHSSDALKFNSTLKNKSSGQELLINFDPIVETKTKKASKNLSIDENLDTGRVTLLKSLSEINSQDVINDGIVTQDSQQFTVSLNKHIDQLIQLNSEIIDQFLNEKIDPDIAQFIEDFKQLQLDDEAAKESKDLKFKKDFSSILCEKDNSALKTDVFNDFMVFEMINTSD